MTCFRTRPPAGGSEAFGSSSSLALALLLVAHLAPLLVHHLAHLAQVGILPPLCFAEQPVRVLDLELHTALAGVANTKAGMRRFGAFGSFPVLPQTRGGGGIGGRRRAAAWAAAASARPARPARPSARPVTGDAAVRSASNRTTTWTGFLFSKTLL